MQSSTTAHLGDRELLHLVDRDASSWEMDVWARHVLGCETCAGRLAERQQTAALLSGAIGRIQLPAGFPPASESMRAARARRSHVPPVWASTGRRQVALRAAAAVLLLMIPLMLVTPLRAAVVGWLRQGWSELAGLVGGDESAAPAPVPAEAPALSPSYAVSFAPTGPELVVTLAARQRAGVLAIAATTAREASLDVTGGGEESPIVTDAGLRIENASGSTASYRLTLPASVHRVELRVAGEPARELSAADIAGGWSYDFAAGR